LWGNPHPKSPNPHTQMESTNNLKKTDLQTAWKNWLPPLTLLAPSGIWLLILLVIVVNVFDIIKDIVEIIGLIIKRIIK
jgi:hypothetical protein